MLEFCEGAGDIELPLECPVSIKRSSGVGASDLGATLILAALLCI
jgi:hypothetical protein